ncbi:MAG: protein translocase subunit SecF [Candidatus Eisenbacteria bacterium]|nr:protein translocase subunit SecF [Candidatus Eisenbacteria bacterium]
MQFLTNTNFEFINHRRKAFVVSAILIAIGLFSILFHKGLNYSIDFVGGSILEVRFDEPVPTGDIRSSVASTGVGTFEVQKFGDPREILIRVEKSSESGELGSTLLAAFQRDFPDRKAELRREESVGPRIGAELRKKAFLAILFALLGILIYISFRFEFRFAVAAVIALIHDVLITLGAFSLFNMEISLAVIAAFLTIVGYSLNDTIVVFDRIREDLRLYSRQPYDRVLNTAINRTLSRTILTSTTTLVVVLFLLFVGGSVIRDFSIALTVGVVIGTYSSIYVASPILVEWFGWASARSKSKRMK